MRKRYFVVLGLLALCALGLGSRVVSQPKPPAPPDAGDKAAIEALEQQYIKAFNAKDLNAIMASYAPGDQLFVFDAVPPREYPSWEAYKKDWEALFAAYPNPVKDSMSELNITVVGTAAYARHVEAGHFTRKDGSGVDVVVPVTDVFRKINGKWLIVQEHVSFPVDIDSGKGGFALEAVTSGLFVDDGLSFPQSNTK
jgi:ketosteroid isomerase-like protein